MNRFNIFIKRLFDIIFSLLVFLSMGGAMLIIYTIASFDLKSNGIFVQKRIGKNLKRFSLYKIRSMKNIPGFNLTTTSADDPRVSTFGSFIRKTKIDELPQIFNVLFGHMSVVGPRPTVEEDMLKMNEEQMKRFNVRPGLTGLAQINGNTSLQWPQRIEYDLKYIENYSFWLDVKIIFKTVQLILTGAAETHPRFEDEWEEIDA